MVVAATELTVDDTGSESITISWTVRATAGQQRIIYRRADDGTGPGDWQTHNTVDINTSSSVVDGLLHGERYDLRVITIDDGQEVADESLASGQTTTVSSGETTEFVKPHVNSGVVDVAGVFQPVDTQS